MEQGWESIAEVYAEARALSALPLDEKCLALQGLFPRQGFTVQENGNGRGPCVVMHRTDGDYFLWAVGERYHVEPAAPVKANLLAVITVRFMSAMGIAS